MKISQYKTFLIVLMMLTLSGCATTSSIGNKMVDNKTYGTAYGYGGIDLTAKAKDLCKAINNKDPRCNDASNYYLVAAWSKFGFADGAVGINSLIHKDDPMVEVLKAATNAYGDNPIFVKYRVTPGQLGEIIEIASRAKDGKCYWKGLPKMGGVVCPAYDYDYRKDYIGVVYR